MNEKLKVNWKSAEPKIKNYLFVACHNPPLLGEAGGGGFLHTLHNLHNLHIIYIFPFLCKILLCLVIKSHAGGYIINNRMWSVAELTESTLSIRTEPRRGEIIHSINNAAIAWLRTGFILAFRKFRFATLTVKHNLASCEASLPSTIILHNLHTYIN